MTAAPVPLVLALDPGADSVGWALVNGPAARAARNPAELGDAVVGFGVFAGGAPRTVVDGLVEAVFDRHDAERNADLADLASTSLGASPFEPGKFPTWLAEVLVEQPPEKIRASEFKGNHMRSLVVQGQIGGILAGAVSVAYPLADVSFWDSGRWRARARARMADVGLLYGPGFPWRPERPMVDNSGKQIRFLWPCDHLTAFGTSWCTVCAPVDELRTQWKASACSSAAELLGDRWDAFAAPARSRSRTAKRDHQRPGLHDAAEAVLQAIAAPTAYRLLEGSR